MSRNRAERSKCLIAATLLCMSIAVTAACSAEPAPEVDGMEWVLVGWFEGNTCAVPAVESAGVTLEFFPADGLVRGSTGCNLYGGSYEMSGNSLTIVELEATEEACPNEGLAQQERAYLDTLIQAESFSIEDGTLRIDCGPRGLVFESQPS